MSRSTLSGGRTPCPPPPLQDVWHPLHCNQPLDWETRQVSLPDPPASLPKASLKKPEQRRGGGAQRWILSMGTRGPSEDLGLGSDSSS